MHLKSLELKGFKSFADRSVLALEPGVTAIVGPNGSGKSNISDAVLWVLGERNAKHLRGQAMEDVIFAGSSARKPVGVAEVDLVLDNSDGTLPVDYDEVAITRRMYRSGESEYLINGVACRRMDVLDILHDSGLGTGTHSIISQGNLDSILQSRPEDRRALIEEAAGVLKHKQRKAKSERKLASMDESLRRARDIAAEVQRQLGPLERKAKRARSYAQAASQLADLNASLAVDDLRRLQRDYNEAKRRQGELSAQLEQRRAAVEAAERQVQQLQEQVREDSADAGEIARRQRRASTAVERLEAAGMLLEEKSRAAAQRDAALRAEIAGNAAAREAAGEGRRTADSQLAQVCAERARAEERAERLASEQQQALRTRRELEGEVERLQRGRRDDEQARERTRRELEQARKELVEQQARTRAAEARRDELAAQLARAVEQLDAAEQAQARANELLEQALAAEAVARGALEEADAACSRARGRAEQAREEEAALASELKGLAVLARAEDESNPALAWAREYAREAGLAATPFAEAVRVRADLEPLVELLLGRAAQALVVDDVDDAVALARAVCGSACRGEVVIVPAGGVEREARAELPDAHVPVEPVCDAIVCDAGMRGAADALLGDAATCGALDAEVLRACAGSARVATPEGCVAGPRGVLVVDRTEAPGAEGALARARRTEELQVRLEAARAERAQAGERLQAAQEALQRAQEEALGRAQKLAAARGSLSSAEADVQRARAARERVSRELASVEAQRRALAAPADGERPCVESLEERLSSLDAAVSRADERLAQLARELAPARSETARLRDELAEAKLSAATLAEREAYAKRMSATRADEIASLVRSDAEARDELFRNEQVARRLAELLVDIDSLLASARRVLQDQERRAAAAQSASSGLHERSAAASARARDARAALDEATEALTASRVEEGRLEVQVGAAVDSIEQDCGMSLEAALSLPELADRAEVEESAAKLRRRIANMGTINPDAAEEYERVRERSDYLEAQLSDLEGARRSLDKIVRAIDDRMRDDFVNTYREVDANFQEIFGILFPGGSAHLSLVDPDDMENTGVEVTAQPRGKRVAKMSLLSGGEKSLTALALLFAVYRTRSTPFYILDEVEAALDDTNLRRLIAYLDTLRGDTQLIMITHQRRTMEMADVLFGVSMQADGVTKVISQKLDRALSYAR